MRRVSLLPIGQSESNVRAIYVIFNAQLNNEWIHGQVVHILARCRAAPAGIIFPPVFHFGSAILGHCFNNEAYYMRKLILRVKQEQESEKELGLEAKSEMW